MNSWSESTAVFVGEEEAEDHVTEVARVVVKRCDPVVEANRIRIAAQVTKILHRYKRSNEEFVLDRFALNDLTQHLRARLLLLVKRGYQLGLVAERDLRILFEGIYILKILQPVITIREFGALRKRISVNRLTKKL